MIIGCIRLLVKRKKKKKMNEEEEEAALQVGEGGRTTLFHPHRLPVGQKAMKMRKNYILN